MKSLIPILIVMSLAGLLVSASETQPESVCYGKTKRGRISGAVQLPLSGKNYVAYSKPAWDLGRTYVHSTVRDIWVKSLKLIESVEKDYIYVYAETGFEDGGKFSPHKTHQNGLSVDVMVPVFLKKTGQRVAIDTNDSNLWGYEIEFDAKGETADYKIDFDSLGLLIETLHRSAVENNIDIWRVILDPRYHEFLLESQSGDYIKKHVYLPTAKPWVRHDEHIHIDFKISCKPL